MTKYGAVVVGRWVTLATLLAYAAACGDRGAQKAAAVGLLPELEGRDGAGDEAALLGPQGRERPACRAARLLRVVFEMVQPDPEIAEHGNVRRRARRESLGANPADAVTQLWRIRAARGFLGHFGSVGGSQRRPGRAVFMKDQVLRRGV